MKYTATGALAPPETKGYELLRDGQIIQVTELYPDNWTVLVQFLIQKHELRELYEALRTYHEEIDRNCKSVKDMIQMLNPYLEEDYIRYWREEEGW